MAVFSSCTQLSWDGGCGREGIRPRAMEDASMRTACSVHLVAALDQAAEVAAAHGLVRPLMLPEQHVPHDCRHQLIALLRGAHPAWFSHLRLHVLGVDVLAHECVPVLQLLCDCVQMPMRRNHPACGYLAGTRTGRETVALCASRASVL